MNSISKRTVVLGASPNPARYSHMAVEKLNNYGHEVIPFGLRKGEIDGISIRTDLEYIKDVDTISLYVGPQNQKSYYDFILELNPERVILNPGTYNPELIELLNEKGIESVEACTLVMLSAKTY